MPVRYRIGEFADLSGVSTKTLRFYDEIGILRPASTDARTRYRYYLPQQLEELASILALKDIGLPLAEIRNLNKKAHGAVDQITALKDFKRAIERSVMRATQTLSWINAAIAGLEDSVPPVPVVVKRRPAIQIASIRSRVKGYAEIESFERALLTELPVESVGDLRGVLWHRCADSGTLEGEAFVALKRKLPLRGAYDVKELPAATLACAYSGLDEQSAERAYDAIRQWMKIRNYRLRGAKRELSLDQILEIQFPIQST